MIGRKRSFICEGLVGAGTMAAVIGGEAEVVMSIYATEWVLKFPRYGEYHTGCEWIEVVGQGVPAHIGSPSPGCGYEDGDPYGAFLPPAIPVVDEDDFSALRAMVIVLGAAKKRGQEYVEPLLVLSGQEYAQMPFAELHDKVCRVLRGHGPRCIAEQFSGNGSIRVLFEDGLSQDVRPLEDDKS